MLTPDQYRARKAFLKFQSTLEWFELEMEPLVPQMSVECQFELGTMGRIARSFFRMANMEIFSQASVEQVTSIKKEAGIRETEQPRSGGVRG